MKIKDFIVKIKRKDFATYEYNESFNNIKPQIASISQSSECIVALLDDSNNRIESLNSEILNAIHHESNTTCKLLMARCRN